MPRRLLKLRQKPISGVTYPCQPLRGELWKHRTDKPGPDPAPETPVSPCGGNCGNIGPTNQGQTPPQRPLSAPAGGTVETSDRQTRARPRPRDPCQPLRGELWKHRTDKPGPDPAPETPVPALRGVNRADTPVLLLGGGGQNWTARPVLANLAPFPETEVHKPINPGSAAAYAGSHSRPDARAYPGACRPRWNPGWSDEPKLKPRWDVHLGGDDDQLGCAGESLSSVLGECPGSVFDPPICAFHLGFSLGGLLAYAGRSTGLRISAFSSTKSPLPHMPTVQTSNCRVDAPTRRCSIRR